MPGRLGLNVLSFSSPEPRFLLVIKDVLKREALRTRYDVLKIIVLKVRSYDSGGKNRSVGATALNLDSSRSHSIFNADLESSCL